MDQSAFLRQFTPSYGQEIPDFARVERTIVEIRPETWEAINGVLVGYPAAKKMEDKAQLRTGTLARRSASACRDDGD